MTAANSVVNMRVHLYGVQGSGSVFPSRAERLAYQELTDLDLLTNVFVDLGRRCDSYGKLRQTLTDILGGPMDRQHLLAYRRTMPFIDPRVYGGWTTCVHVETSDGHDFVLDCGSGFRNCAKALQAKWGDREERHLHVFGSHSHLDHTEGFDQAAVCFDGRNHLHIYGNVQFLKALDVHLGIFSHHVADDVRGVQTPIHFAMMPAKFDACEIRDLSRTPANQGAELAQRQHHLGDAIRIGETTITAFEVCHPAPCLAYRFEHHGKVFVFCTDHELRHGDDDADPALVASRAAEQRVRQHAGGADLLYRDGQYFRVEYDGIQGIGTTGAVPRVGWGHSCIEDVRDMARDCAVKRTLIGHHDPNREWSERNWIDSTLARSAGAGDAQVELARAETSYDL